MTPPNAEEVVASLCFGDITMDLLSHRVRRQGRPVRLTPSEFELLCQFLTHPRRVFTRVELLKPVRDGTTLAAARKVDGRVAKLRRALNRDGAPNVIHTVRSVGYALYNAGVA